MSIPAHTRSEEDHLKAVHALVQEGAAAGTKDLADRLGTRSSSVTVMLKKLAAKGLLKHEPYYGVKLTAKGKAAALKLVRKHRLWETFLVDRLGFGWDEVHEVAEQLEHVRSEKLTEKLAEYLGDPAYDPHGDPIPDRAGNMPLRDVKALSDCNAAARVRIVAVEDGSDALLQLLAQKGIGIGKVFTLVGRQDFDQSVELSSADGAMLSLSARVASHLLVQPAAARKPKQA